jgi:DNA polymerase III subunit gamma/tau
MSYQVLARKWRPQRFGDVLGQQAVTRTLQNALKSKRIAQAFVFAGPRGCGKTTTARLLARALNCVQGPTIDPCGVCEPCVEIAEGRDIDVLEIDAATHTGVDNVREVIIEGLSIAPVRNRYKVFLIDEVHMLSASSFNALLKSIEEPPPHVVFMMATTELQKIPDTVLSRSQVYEFRTISGRIVADRLRHIATEEGIAVPDEALLLLARAGEGSMRDSLSAFDQVRAFAGDEITVEDVTTVLGLVGRDLVFDMIDAVAGEDAPAAFALVERAIERGYDLRLLCRELARAIRDLLIVSVDAGRLGDPDVAADSERDRVRALEGRFSREELLRAFDVLTRAEQEIRGSDQPRFNMEMALLRLMHLRKLVPLAELIERFESGSAPSPSRGPAMPVSRPSAAPARSAPPVSRPAASAPPGRAAAAPPPRPAAVPAAPMSPRMAGDLPPNARDLLLAAVKAAKVFFYNAVVAQAYRIDVTPVRITFAFLAAKKVPRQQCQDAVSWLEGLAEQVLGRRLPVLVTVVEPDEAGPAGDVAQGSGAASATAARTGEPLRDAALANPSVQALLEVFPVEGVSVEEVEPQ